MRNRQRWMSRGATGRAKRNRKKQKKRNCPPKGIGGGEEGRIRGEMSEERVVQALEFKKTARQIVGYEQRDVRGIDFFIFVEKRCKNKWRRKKPAPVKRLSLQVKSSKRNMFKHQEESDVPMVVVGNYDSIFDIVFKIDNALNLS
ncbi:hypothetical protein KKE13_03405 [Patescibacteria group bacterium]|nr:hypothetical protein [Patescibacteria group bacterium]